MLRCSKAIKELTRVVKLNSSVIVSVDSEYSIISRLIAENSFNKLLTFIKTGILKREHKFQAFALGELRKIFENVGLKVVKIIGKPVLIQLIPREGCSLRSHKLLFGNFFYPQNVNCNSSAAVKERKD